MPGETFDALRTRSRLDHEHLLMLAAYADALLEAARVVNDARERADELVAAARRDADRVRSESAAAEKALADARRRLEELRAEIDRTHRTNARSAAALADVETGIRADTTEQIDAEPIADLDPAPSADLVWTRAEVIPRALDGFPSGHIEAADAGAHSDRAPDDVPVTAVDPETTRRRSRVAVLAACAMVAVLAGAWWLRSSGAASSVAARARAAEPAPTAKPARPAVVPAPQPAAPEPTRLSAVIRASRSAWLRLDIDGTMERGGFIRAGERREVTADRELEVRTGDGGALLVSVNGTPEAPIGRSGADATRRWTLADPDRAARPADQPPSSRPVAAERVARPDAPAAAAATTGVADATVDQTRSTRDQILDADRRWFDGLYRQLPDVRRELQSPDFELVDRRPAADRPAPGTSIERIVRSVQINTWGDSAVVSGVMTERWLSGGTRDVDSLFAEIWVRSNGRWQLMGLRLNPPTDAELRTKR